VALVIVHIHAGCLNAAPLIVFYMELFPCIKYLKTLTHLACACTLHDQHSTIFACSHVSAFAAFWAWCLTWHTTNKRLLKAGKSHHR